MSVRAAIQSVGRRGSGVGVSTYMCPYIWAHCSFVLRCIGFLLRESYSQKLVVVVVRIGLCVVCHKRHDAWPVPAVV